MPFPRYEQLKIQFEQLKKKLESWEEALSEDPDNPYYEQLFFLYRKELARLSKIYIEMEKYESKAVKYYTLFD